MIQKTTICAMTVALFAVKVAAADLIPVNDPSISGNGIAARDGFNLTRDTETGLDWLDLTLSVDRSFNDVSTQFGAGGDYEGFGFANRAELETLFDHAGLVLDDTGPDVSPAILDFLSLFGSELAPIEAGNVSAGRYDETVDGNDDFLVGSGRVSDVFGGPAGMLAYVRIAPDNAGGPAGALGDPSLVLSNVGSFLVRPIPPRTEQSCFMLHWWIGVSSSSPQDESFERTFGRMRN